MMKADVLELSREAYAFMTGDPASYSDGKHDLGNGVSVNIMTYDTKLRQNAVYEAHQAYVDIQLILDGQEIISVEPLETMHAGTCLAEFDLEKDVELYAGNMSGVDHVLRAGEYLILGPQQAHMPGICIGSPSRVRKAVVKVPVK